MGSMKPLLGVGGAGTDGDVWFMSDWDEWPPLLLSFLLGPATQVSLFTEPRTRLPRVPAPVVCCGEVRRLLGLVLEGVVMGRVVGLFKEIED